jgi:hypothetical protein
MELVVASTISVVVVLALGQVDVTRLLLSQRVRDTAQTNSEALFALAALVRDAQQADRVNVVSASDVQLRLPAGNCVVPAGVPDPGCFDNPANYRWVEYKLAGTTVQFFDDTAGGACGVDRTFYDITALSVAYVDAVTQAPPGGEPFAASQADSNVLQVQMTTAPSQTGDAMTYTDVVTLRAGVYSNVNASGSDSGSGLASAASVLPTPC